MKGLPVIMLLVGCAVAVPLLAGVGVAGTDRPVLVAQADSDIRSVADLYVNGILPKYPNPVYQNPADNGYISEKRLAEVYNFAYVPRDRELCRVLAALQGYTRYARNHAELLESLRRLKRAANSGGYMPTVAGHPNIISDLEQVSMPVKLPPWEEIVKGTRVLAAAGFTSDRVGAFGDINIWDKLYTGLGSLRQIDAWLEEVYRPMASFRWRAGKKPPR